MKASIGRLPEEIQGYILTKLDGKSIAIAKKVCRLWNEILTGLETCMHIWLRCCLKEISTYSLVQLTRLIQLSGGREITLAELAHDWKASLESKLPWMFWREVYAENYRCCYIEKGLEKKTELHFFPLNGEVSCLHVQDNVIYSGHESGVLMSWKNIEADLNCDVVYRHQRRVTSITGLDMVMSTADILNGEVGSKIVSSSRDTTLIIHNIDTEESSTIKHYSKQVNCVRSWGSHFVAAANASMIQGQPIWTSADQLDIRADITCTLFSQSASDIKAVAFWEDSVVSGDELGNLFQWSGCLGCQKSRDNKDMNYITNLKSPVKCLFLLGSRIVCYTADNHLHISCYNDGEHVFERHDMYKAMTMTPQCIAIHGPLLAVGCKSGFVYLYHIPSDSYWDCLDLSQPSRIIQTSHEHVNAIVIGDDGGGPFVVIATEGYCITVVQFRKCKKKCR